ncbi:hypothetical protein OPT61_g7588 [Boeremia exigua]|uniref:Uncharacterized protein n=1 Tax=Boeremia exigua TaxID=749465 RepID=A0ACC2I280_9PLEO|nr:hypothetical protein OPT61_g7588 [Boeremia exigua]
MADSWRANFTDWYKYWRRRQVSDVESFVDIELDATRKDNDTVDSNTTYRQSTSFSSSHYTPTCASHPPLTDPIYLRIDFGDDVCQKSLDYGTFSHWSAVEGLMIDMEEDGMIFEELWDVNESMKICMGDWDARVRPGWDVHVHCQSGQAMLETRYLEEDSDSEYSESEEDHWIDEILDPYQEEWCLPRWREKVELEKSKIIAMQEPSWIMLGLGCASVTLFIIAAVVYTA